MLAACCLVYSGGVKNGVRFTYKGILTPYFHARESIFSRAEPAAWVVSM